RGRGGAGVHPGRGRTRDARDAGVYGVDAPPGRVYRGPGAGVRTPRAVRADTARVNARLWHPVYAPLTTCGSVWWGGPVFLVGWGAAPSFWPVTPRYGCTGGTG